MIPANYDTLDFGFMHSTLQTLCGYLCCSAIGDWVWCVRGGPQPKVWQYPYIYKGDVGNISVQLSSPEYIYTAEFTHVVHRVGVSIILEKHLSHSNRILSSCMTQWCCSTLQNITPAGEVVLDMVLQVMVGKLKPKNTAEQCLKCVWKSSTCLWWLPSINKQITPLLGWCKQHIVVVAFIFFVDTCLARSGFISEYPTWAHI